MFYARRGADTNHRTAAGIGARCGWATVCLATVATSSVPWPYTTSLLKSARGDRLHRMLPMTPIDNHGANNPNWKGGLVERYCKTCGAVFHVKQKVARRGHGLFCGRKCWGQWRSKTMVGDKAPHWQGGPPAYTCQQCGKPFVAEDHAKREYCSHACYSASRRQPEGNRVYSAEWAEPFRRGIRERDNYTCAMCGARGKTVHHIDYNKRNTTPGNCITLCKTCHSKTNVSNRKHWTEMLAPVAKERESAHADRGSG